MQKLIFATVFLTLITSANVFAQTTNKQELASISSQIWTACVRAPAFIQIGKDLVSIQGLPSEDNGESTEIYLIVTKGKDIQYYKDPVVNFPSGTIIYDELHASDTTFARKADAYYIANETTGLSLQDSTGLLSDQYSHYWGLYQNYKSVPDSAQTAVADSALAKSYYGEYADILMKYGSIQGQQQHAIDQKFGTMQTITPRILPVLFNGQMIYAKANTMWSNVYGVYLDRKKLVAANVNSLTAMENQWIRLKTYMVNPDYDTGIIYETGKRPYIAAKPLTPDLVNRAKALVTKCQAEIPQN